MNDVSVYLGTVPGVFFFWTHFRLSLWMATHLRMPSATPSVYLDGRVEYDQVKQDCGCKTTQVILNNKELSL